MNYQILKIKLSQIIECIDYYTSEPSINILINEVRNAIAHDKQDVILYLIKELMIWYQDNMQYIMKNEFVTNKEVHLKNSRILQELLEYMENNDIKNQIQPLNNINDEEPLKNVIKLISKFHSVAKQLRYRHNSRATLDITDEYDVQDLMNSLLYIFFDDVRDEEWTPSYAGKCSRQDFLLKNENIVIEIKKTRKNLTEKELCDQLLIDIARYKSHPNCKTLVCFVYDPEERIKNPIGIESDLTTEHDGLKVIVKIIQK